MRSRFLGRSMAVVLSAALMTGCAQMARHSNTLMFGTNTTIGLGVGQGADQTPKIDIGYNRQEVAIVPLLANTNVDGSMLKPCPKDKVADCKFEASHNGTDKDSYSTLASFGGTAGTDSANSAEVSVAQYFATGVAAQQLVMAGGANVVQAGGDTKAKAEAAETAAELRIEQERSNAASFKKDLDAGGIAARAILGPKDNSVDSGKRQTLASSMPGPGTACADTELEKLDQTTVENFLTELRQAKPICLQRLAKYVQQ